MCYSGRPCWHTLEQVIFEGAMSGEYDKKGRTHLNDSLKVFMDFATCDRALSCSIINLFCLNASSAIDSDLP